MTCSRLHREFSLEPALWAPKATLSRFRQGLNSNSRACAEIWRETRVKEVRLERAIGKEARKDCRGRCVRSTISN